jgi:diguanylate cyclase (GGDEF)-like protein
MIINNIILEEKHLYMQILLNAETIKKQEELSVLQNEKRNEQLQEIKTIWNNAFVGLLRSGLKYDFIKNESTNTDIIRLTIDNIQFDCAANELKNMLKDQYDAIIDEHQNVLYMKDVSIMDSLNNNAELKSNDEKSEKEKELEREIQSLKDKATRQKEKYMFEVNHDAMTGLYNKKAFVEDINDLTDKAFYVLSLDANELKRTNDTLGHAFGDKLLTSIASMIKEVFGERSYRTGGDEFYVISIDDTEESIIDKVTELKNKLASNSESGMTFSVSAGYAYVTKNGDKQDAIEKADKEMYKDKKKYRIEHHYVDSRISNALSPEEIGSDDVVPDHIADEIIENKKIEQVIKAGQEEEEIKFTFENTEKEINTIENNSDSNYEKYKDLSTFVYDTYDITILAPGSSKGEPVKVLIAPLRIYKDNNHPEIMCMLVNKFGEVQRYVSEQNAPTLKIEFMDYELIIRGVFVNGKFSSYILPSGSTLAMGFSININAYVAQRSLNDELTNNGHILFAYEGYKFNVVPLSKTNDNNGIAHCLICVEKPDGTKSLVSTNPNAITLFEDNNTSYRILTYWQDSMLCSEIMEE